MPVTIDDVARTAGVSTATVSRALRGLPHVNESTRAAVHRIALDLGYDSPSAFIHAFRRALGTTPGAYFAAAA